MGRSGARTAPAENKADDEKDEEDEEQDLRDPDRRTGDPAETEYAGDYRHDEEKERPTEHISPPGIVVSVGGGMTWSPRPT